MGWDTTPRFRISEAILRAYCSAIAPINLLYAPAGLLGRSRLGSQGAGTKSVMFWPKLG